MTKGIEISISKRKLYSLFLLNLMKEIEGTTRFHKLMFILKQEHNIPIDYKFIKYHYGPFSSELREDINFFTEQNFMNSNSLFIGEDEKGYPIIKTTYKISNKGKKIFEKQFAKKEEKELFIKAISKWGKAPLNKLIAHAKSLQ
ncbi:hypothetical protein KKG83_06000 [Candidatus Micrarchaeota archaeon]|nr:hypothetical protein [Candidatus Micrarchaeota archaeon]MBU2476996.1 hypothetical protein [Candidatus Micrarchaeota archaeon]